VVSHPHTTLPKSFAKIVADFKYEVILQPLRRLFDGDRQPGRDVPADEPTGDRFVAFKNTSNGDKVIFGVSGSSTPDGRAQRNTSILWIDRARRTGAVSARPSDGLLSRSAGVLDGTGRRPVAAWPAWLAEPKLVQRHDRPAFALRAYGGHPSPAFMSGRMMACQP
jgi:hypothetical protein